MKPKCPRGCPGKPAPHAGKRFKCNRCGGVFDHNPAEGGDYHADPAKRMMIAEAAKRAKP
jgi:hypothetical protein